MKQIRDILAEDKRGISFEVFPPKKETSLESVKQTTERIGTLRPSFMSVTYGAGGGTSAFTLDIAKNIEDKTNTPVLCHLTCVSTSREDIEKQLDRMKELSLTNVMALRGDIPEGGEDRSKWGFLHASDLVECARSRGDFTIGGACYPEGHPESVSTNEDILNLKKKVDAGVDFLTTQMFFDNNVYYNFLFKAREAGITCPIVPGIMPITKANQLERALKLSGSFVPRKFSQIVDRFGSDNAAMEQAGIIYATNQIVDLFANGINHVHLYTMNSYDVASAIYNNISSLIEDK